MTSANGHRTSASAANRVSATRARATADDSERDDGVEIEHNLPARQAAALDLLSRGHGVEHIMRVCGYKSHRQARRAIDAARRAIAEDTAEEHRLNFKASYGPVRVALHAKARRGDVRAVEALVKLDERECRLFGLDLTPTDAMLSVHYTKRILLEELPTLPAPEPAPESEPVA